MTAVSDGTRLEMPSLEGYLFKRSPKKTGILGAVSLQGWQRRWCALFPKAGKFCYSKQQKDMDGVEAKLQGIIPIDRIEKIMVLRSKSSKNPNRRFDLQMEGGRVFCFQAMTEEESQQWVQALATCQKARVKSLEKRALGTAYWKPNKRQVETKMDLSVHFEHTAFMHRMTAAQVRTLASFFTKKQFTAKSMVFSESAAKITDMSDEGVFYVILKGEVSIYLESVQSSVCFCVKQAGDFLDASTLVQGARIATALCTTDVECLRLSMVQLAAYLSEFRSMRQVVQPLMGINPAPELKSLPMFAGMETQKLHLIACLLRYVPVVAGQVLFEERSPPLSMFFVVQGAVLVEANDRGEKKILHTFCAGELFGEAGVLLDMPRLATATAKQDSLLLELRKQDLGAFLKLVGPEETTRLNAYMQLQVALNFRKHRSPFFAAIPDDKFRLLAELSLIRQFPPKTVLFREGEVGKKFYIIVYGKVRVTQDRTEEGVKVETELGRRGPGGYFGEIALVRDSPRLATVTTIDRCIVFTLSKTNFEQFCQEVPEAVADFEVKLARSGVGLRSVVFHKLGLKFFREHLQMEFSDDNLAFWKYARNFRMLLDRRFEETFDAPATPEPSSKDEPKSFTGKSFASERKRWTHVVSCWEAVAHTKHSESLGELANAPRPGLRKSASMGSLGAVTAAATAHAAAQKSGIYELTQSIKPLEEESKSASTRDLGLNEEAEEVDYSWVTVAGLCEGVKIVLGLELDQAMAKCCASTQDPNRVTHESWVAAFDTMGDKLPIRTALDKVLELVYNSFVRFAEDNCLDPKQFADAIASLGHRYDMNEARTAFTDIVLAEAQMRERLTSRPPARNRVSYDQLLRWHLFEQVQKYQYRQLVRKQATHIFEQWISSSSPTQVNLMSSSLISLANDMKRGRICATMFEGAETEIFNLMAADSFSRFKLGKLFQKFLQEAESYDATYANVKEKNKLTAKKKATEARLRGQSCLTRDQLGIGPSVSGRRVSTSQQSSQSSSQREEFSPPPSPSRSAAELYSGPRFSFVVPPLPSNDSLAPAPLEYEDDDEVERIPALPHDFDLLLGDGVSPAASPNTSPALSAMNPSAFPPPLLSASGASFPSSSLSALSLRAPSISPERPGRAPSPSSEVSLSPRRPRSGRATSPTPEPFRMPSPSPDRTKASVTASLHATISPRPLTPPPDRSATTTNPSSSAASSPDNSFPRTPSVDRKPAKPPRLVALPADPPPPPPSLPRSASSPDLSS